MERTVNASSDVFNIDMLTTIERTRYRPPTAFALINVYSLVSFNSLRIWSAQ